MSKSLAARQDPPRGIRDGASVRAEELPPFHGAPGRDRSSRLPPDQPEIKGSRGGTGKAGAKIGFSLLSVGCGDPGVPSSAFLGGFHPFSHVIPFQTRALPCKTIPIAVQSRDWIFSLSVGSRSSQLSISTCFPSLFLHYSFQTPALPWERDPSPSQSIQGFWCCLDLSLIFGGFLK